MFLLFSKIVFFIILYRNNKIKTEAIRLSGINLFLPNGEFIKNEICGGLNIDNPGRDIQYCSSLSDEVYPESEKPGWEQLYNSDLDKYYKPLLNNTLVIKDPKRSIQIVNNKNYIRGNRKTATTFPISKNFIKRFCDSSLNENSENSEVLNNKNADEQNKSEEKITLMQLEKENQDSMLKQFRENQRKLRPVLVIKTKNGIIKKINNPLFKRNTFSAIHLNNSKIIDNYSWREKKSLEDYKLPIIEEYFSHANKKGDIQVKGKRSLGSKVKALAAKTVQKFRDKKIFRRRKHSILSSHENLPKRSLKLKYNKIPTRSFSVISDMKEMDYPHVRSKHQEILRSRNCEYFSSVNKHSEPIKNNKNKHSLTKDSSVVGKEKRLQGKKKLRTKLRKKNKKMDHHKTAEKKHAAKEIDTFSNFTGEELKIRDKKHNSNIDSSDLGKLHSNDDNAMMKIDREVNIIGELTHVYDISCDRTCSTPLSVQEKTKKKEVCIYTIGTERVSCIPQIPPEALERLKKITERPRFLLRAK